NMSEVARQLNCNRATVKKYSGDVFGFGHAIINGRLMTKYKHAKGDK
ncbi:protein ninH, partial [Escherichia coli]|nr:protein ninH [Escherichia coli]